MFKKTALIFAALALSVSSAMGATIADIGSATIGDKTFSDFSMTNIDESLVTVTLFQDPDGTIGVAFNGPMAVLNGIVDYTLQFKVTVNDPDYFITSIGQSMTAGVGGLLNSVSIDESVWADGFGLGTKLANSTISAGATGDDPNDPEPEEWQGDNLVLSEKSQEVWITKDILLDGSNCAVFGDDQQCSVFGQARATTIRQRFFQERGDDVPDVPEPATMLLFSTALLGLGYMRRKKS